MTQGKSTFMLRQRAFIKLYLITMTEQKRLYGFKIWETLEEEFKEFGYKPQRSEIYKSLHELLDDGILKSHNVEKEGTKRQEVVVYQFKNHDEAKAYKKLLKAELDRCVGLLQKALKDNYV